jgi:hypothetical protein
MMHSSCLLSFFPFIVQNAISAREMPFLEMPPAGDPDLKMAVF